MICYIPAFLYKLLITFILLNEISVFSIIIIVISILQVKNRNKVYPELKEKWSKKKR